MDYERQSKPTKEHHDALLRVFHKLPEQVKEQLYKWFKTVDRNDDGSISPEELKCHLQSTDLYVDDVTFEEQWRRVDVDSNGHLDLNECAAMFVMSKLCPGNCSECGAFLLDATFFACIRCCDQYRRRLLSGEGRDPSLKHLLCSKCKSRGKHPQWDPLRLQTSGAHEFEEVLAIPGVRLEQHTFLRNLGLESIQCEVCGIFHTVHSQLTESQSHLQQSYLGHENNQHMVMLEDGRQACEFCAYSTCHLCGDLCLAEKPRRGVWTKKGKCRAPKAHTQARHRVSKYKTDHQALVKRAMNNEFLQCTTCQLSLVTLEMKGLKLRRHAIRKPGVDAAEAALQAAIYQAVGVGLENALGEAALEFVLAVAVEVILAALGVPGFGIPCLLVKAAIYVARKLAGT